MSTLTEAPNGTLVRVLIVDDTPDVRLLLRSALECSGSFAVIGEASDGRGAIDLARQHQPDLILLDLAMPIMNGLEAIPEITRGAPDSRIVVLSGFNADRMATQALELGATTYIEKRHRPDELVRLILEAAEIEELSSAPSSVEAAARTERDQFRLVFDSAPIGTALVDFEGRFTQVNDAFCRIVGRTQAELIDPAISELEDLTHPADAGADLALLAQLITGDRAAYQMEKRYLRSDGTTLWVLLNRSIMFDEEGRAAQVITQVVDISTEKAANARYRTAMEALAESERRLAQAQQLARIGSWEWDVDADRISWSAELYQIYGVDPEEFDESYGGFLDRVHPDDRALVEAHIRHAVEAVEPFETEHRVIRKDGSVCWVVGKGQVVTGDDGRVVRMFGTTQDTTERKRTEEKLRSLASELSHANAELARSNADLSQFAAVAAHDLKSPLQVILGYVELMQRLYGAQLDDRGNQFLQALLNACGRMDSLIDDLLAYCQVGSEEQTLEPVDLGVVVDESVSMLRREIEETDARVTRDALPIVVADVGQMRQLMQNLLTNALKFTREGVPARIHVSARRAEDGWLVAVTDNGVGVDPGQRERVFGMFERLHGSRYPGTGIGLAICKRIVTRRGGQVWIDEGEEGGSQFCFTLPDKTEDVDVPSEPEVGVSAVVDQTRDVLLVEDSGDHAALIGALLEEATVTYHLQRAQTVAEARAIVRDEVPDCILLDLILPDAHGLEALSELRSAAPRAPIVVITSRSDEALALAAVREGAQDYLVKGRIDGELLSRSIGYAIERAAVDADVAHGALHDALTGLANRTLLHDRLQLSLARAKRGAGGVAILYLDLDGFKTVNDTLGHQAGDAVLVAVAERVRRVVRPEDTVARLGGDEFVVLCDGISATGAELRSLQDRIEAAVRAPFSVQRETVRIDVSVGMAVSQDGAVDAVDLLREADTRMYAAKRARD